ncbi:hypothetical protein J4218_01170 [Candidatus Pacearchaeota archaeon]|nr:hypothetical protein [Candidatus Pacearchaeota archaeon]
MGSNKGIEKTRRVKVRHMISDTCNEVVDALNRLEAILQTNLPAVNSDTAMSHLDLQEAWYQYCHRLVNSIELIRIKNSGSESVLNSLYPELLPGFVEYLQKFGSVSFGRHVSYKNNVGRVGVFIARGIEQEGNFLGIFEQGDEHFSYSGYVPINVSEEEFHRPSVHDVSKEESLCSSVYPLGSSGIDGGNFAYVRLFAEKTADGFERLDGFLERGIKFP